MAEFKLPGVFISGGKMGYIENCKKAPTFLEKGDQKKKFTTQSVADHAWAESWYAPGRPESMQKLKPKKRGPKPKKDDE